MGNVGAEEAKIASQKEGDIGVRGILEEDMEEEKSVLERGEAEGGGDEINHGINRLVKIRVIENDKIGGAELENFFRRRPENENDFFPPADLIVRAVANRIITDVLAGRGEPLALAPKPFEKVGDHDGQSAASLGVRA